MRLRARRIINLRPAELGGHRLVKGGPKWQCMVCKASSKYWDRIAAGQCKGSVAKKWAVKAQDLAMAGATLGGGHTFLLSGSVIWCAACGAFTDDGSVKALAKPCSGEHRRAHHKWDESRNYPRRRMLRQLLKLRAGLHPTRGTLLPPPVNIDPAEDLPAGMAEQYRASEAGRLYAATEQDLNPRMQSMLERVRKRDRERNVAARVVRRQIGVTSHPSVCIGYELPTGVCNH